jgi:uncharacterized tellurite resistance protein B-like protein
MFERLIKSLGQPVNRNDAPPDQDPELQLAAALLLFGVMPADYKITRDETSALRVALIGLFDFSPERCRRMMARAASMHARESSIVGATTLLKRRASEDFRLRLMREVRKLSRADGVVHDNELDLEHRIERLLGLAPDDLLQTA